MARRRRTRKSKKFLAKVATEDRVRNAVVGHIAQKGFSKNLKIKAADQHGVDISATHVNSDARRIFIETKGHSPGCNKNVAINTAWGQIVGRVTSLNANRVHGVAFPKEWESNVAKLSSPVVAKRLNTRYYFVNSRGDVEDYTAAKFHRKHSKARKKRPARHRKPSKRKRR